MATVRPPSVHRSAVASPMQARVRPFHGAHLVRAGSRIGSGVVTGLGLVAMIAQIPFFISIALTCPWPAQMGLALIWLTQFSAGIHLRARPAAVLVCALAMAASWYFIGTVAAPWAGWEVVVAA